MTFRYRQFEVEDDRSAMKIGTDSMLLGCWADPGKSGTILDIGTGCGVLSLMMAQKSEALITAIDIDRDSANQAAENFARSPWPDRLKALHISLQEFSDAFPGKFDMIISNPPFFAKSLKSPVTARNLARHDETLGMEELFEAIYRILNPNGKFSFIFPADKEEIVIRTVAESGLNLRRKLLIRTKSGERPVRIAWEIAFRTCVEPAVTEIVIRNSDNTHTGEYRLLTREFHSGL